MGKNKHKKHHRHGEEGDDASGSNAGLKLILKVGSNDKSHKKKKKKKEKKKDRDKEGRKHRHHHKDRRGGGLISGSTAEDQDAADVKIEPEEDLDVKPQKALTRLLEQMLHHLQKKDVNNFFRQSCQ